MRKMDICFVCSNVADVALQLIDFCLHRHCANPYRSVYVTVTLRAPKEWTLRCYLTSTCKNATQGRNALLPNVQRTGHLTRSSLVPKFNRFRAHKKPMVHLAFLTSYCCSQFLKEMETKELLELGQQGGKVKHLTLIKVGSSSSSSGSSSGGSSRSGLRNNSFIFT